MAYELATGFVSLTVETHGMGKQILDEFDQAQAKADKAGTGIGSKLAAGMGKALKGGAISAGVAAGGVLGTALVKGLGRLSAIDSAQGKLAGLGHSAGDVGKIMDDALASVKGTAFGLDEAASVAAATVAAGISPGKDLQRVLGLVGDAATIAGTSMGDMGAIFNKVAASNKMQGDIINQLNDAGIPIVQLLGKELGKTSDEIYEMSRKGQIDFATFADAMEEGLGGAALKSGDTFKGAMANMGAALGRFGAELERPLFDRSKGAFAAITAGIDDATDRVKPLAAAFGGWIDETTPKLIAFAGEARDAFNEFRQSDVVRESVQRVGGVFDQLLDTARDLRGPASEIAGSLAEAAAATGVSTWKIFLSLLESGAQILDATLVPAMSTLADLMKNNQGLVNTFALGFLAFRTVPNLIDKVTGGIGTLMTRLPSLSAGSRATTVAVVSDFTRLNGQIGTTGAAMRALGNNSATMRSIQNAFIGASSMAGGFAAALRTGVGSALDGVKNSIRGAVNALGGPVGVGLIATGLTIAGISNVNAKVARSYDEITEAVENAKKGQENLLKAFVGSGGQVTSEVTDTVAANVKSAFDYIDQQSTKSAGQMDKTFAAFDDIIHFRSDWQSLGKLGDQAGEWDWAKDVKKDLDDAGVSADAFARAVSGSEATARAMSNSLLDNEGKVTEAWKTFDRFRSDFKNQKFIADTMSPGVMDLAAAVGVLSDKAGDASSRTSALRKALEALRIIQPDATQQMADYGEAIDQIVDSSADAIDASDGLGASLLNQDGTLDTLHNKGARQLNESLKSLADNFLSAATASGDAQGAFDAAMPALEKLAEQSGLSIDQVIGLARAMGMVPEKVQPFVQLQGADQAVQELNVFAHEVGDVSDKPVTVQMQMKDEGAREYLRGIGAKVTEIDEATGTVRITMDNGLALAGLQAVITKANEVGAVNAVPKVNLDDTGFIFKNNDAHRLLGILDAAEAFPEADLITQKLQEGKALSLQELQDLSNHTADPAAILEIAQLLSDADVANGVLDQLARDRYATVHVSYQGQDFNIPSFIADPNTPGWAESFRQNANGSISPLPGAATIAAGRGRGLVQWAEGETGGEAFIPLAESKRGRSTAILSEVARRFGYSLEAYADGGIRAALSAAQATEGRPYLWGGTGPDGWDCSGLVGYVHQILMGLSAMEAAGKRLYTTYSLIGGQTAGLVPGLDSTAKFNVGVSQEHMAATLDGQNIESGGASVPSSSGVGGNRAGAADTQFPYKFHLPNELIAGDINDSAAVSTLTKPAWSDADEKSLQDARGALDRAQQARASLADDASQEVRDHADLEVARAEKALGEIESKKQGATGVQALTAPAAPPLAGAMDDDAISLRQSEIAVTEAQLARDKTYADVTATSLDREKADMAVYSAQNALRDVQEKAASGAGAGGTTGGLKGVAAKFGSDLASAAYDALWTTIGIDEPRWLSVDIPEPTKPVKPGEDPVQVALRNVASQFPAADLARQLPVGGDLMEDWLKRQGIALHDEGGWLMPGLSLNLTEQPEAVLNPQQLDALYRVADAGMQQGPGRGGVTIVNNNHQRFMDQKQLQRDQERRQVKQLMRHGSGRI